MQPLSHACDEEARKAESSLAAPMGSALYAKWSVVWRGLKPVAAFPTQAMAVEWVNEAAHRKNDVIRNWNYVPIKRSGKSPHVLSTMEWQAKRKNSGLCVTCGKPAVNATHCDKHRIENNTRQRNKSRAKRGIPLDAPLYTRGQNA